MEKGLLVVVSGPSGTGKGTICKALLQEEDISLSISMTTRNPRHNEVEGKNYYFVSKEEFEKVSGVEGFLEKAKVYGNYYGTPKEPVLNKLEKGEDVLLEIDIQGALQIKEAYPNGVFIFVLPPSMEELRKRIIGRGSETEDSINLRLNETLNEIEYIGKYDYCVINDKLEVAVETVKAIIIAEHSKVTFSKFSILEAYKEEM